MNAEWKSGVRHKGVDPDRAAREIERLRKKLKKGDDEECLAEALFNASVDPDTPCHSLFEWDKEAGWKAYNISIGRHIIYGLVVDVSNGGTRKRPLYVSVRGEDSRSYVNTDKDHLDAVLAQIIKDIKNYTKSRAGGFKELEPLVDSVVAWELEKVVAV